MFSIAKLRQQLNSEVIKKLSKFLYEETVEYSDFPKNRREVVFDYSDVSIEVILSTGEKVVFQIKWDLDEKLLVMQALRDKFKSYAVRTIHLRDPMYVSDLKRDWGVLIDRVKDILKVTGGDEKVLDKLKEDEKIIRLFKLIVTPYERDFSWELKPVAERKVKLIIRIKDETKEEILEFAINWTKEGVYSVVYKDKTATIKFKGIETFKDDLFNAIIKVSKLQEDNEFVSWFGGQMDKVIEALEKELGKLYQITPGFGISIYGKGTVVGMLKQSKFIISHTGLNVTITFEWDYPYDKKRSNLKLDIEFKPPSIDWMRTLISETASEKYQKTLLQAVGPMMKFFEWKSKWSYIIKSTDLIWEDDFIKNIGDEISKALDEVFTDIYKSVGISGISLEAFKSWLIHVFGPIYHFVTQLATSPAKYTSWIKFLRVEPKHVEVQVAGNIIKGILGKLKLVIDGSEYKRRSLVVYIFDGTKLISEYEFAVKTTKDFLEIVSKIDNAIDAAAKKIPEFQDELVKIWVTIKEGYKDKFDALIEKYKAYLTEEKSETGYEIKPRKIDKNVEIQANLLTKIPWEIDIRIVDKVGDYELSRRYSVYDFVNNYDAVLRDFIGLADEFKDTKYYNQLISGINSFFLQAYMDIKRYIDAIVDKVGGVEDIDVWAKVEHRLSYISINWKIFGILMELLFDWEKPHIVRIVMKVRMKDDRPIKNQLEISFKDAHDLAVKLPQALRKLFVEIEQRGEIGKALVKKIFRFFDRDREFYSKYVLGHEVGVVFERMTLMPFEDEPLDLKLVINDQDMSNIKINWENRREIIRENVGMNEYGNIFIRTNKKGREILTSVYFSYFVNIRFFEPVEERTWDYSVQVDKKFTLREALAGNILQKLMETVIDNIVKDGKLSLLQRERLILIIENINQQIKMLHNKYNEYVKDIALFEQLVV